MISVRLPCALPSGPIPLGGREVCANTVTVVLNTDDEMTTVAEALRGDPRVTRSYAQTGQDAWEQFQRMFANQPELLEMTGPDGPSGLGDRRAEGPDRPGSRRRPAPRGVPAARFVKNDNELLSRITGPKYTDPTCPSSGERPADHVT